MRELTLPKLEPWPLAARLASAEAFSPWSLVAVPPVHVKVMAEELREQLSSLLVSPVDLADARSPRQVFEVIRRCRDHAVVIHGLDRLGADSWRRIDANRSRLAREHPAIIVISERRLPILVQNAPNLWSWLGGSSWRGVLEGTARAEA